MRFELASRSAVLCALLFVSIGAAGCGEDPPPVNQGPFTTEVLTPDAPPLPGESECRVVKTTGIPVASAQHVETCTPVAYETNPPSGGDHWGTWAAFKKYDSPVPREIYVHDLEHGAVVLAYRCETSCPEVVAALEEVYDGAAGDPLCISAGAGPKARLVLTPDPDLETPIAASAWGATYTATCIDTASLAAFVAQVYGKGPESTCYDGVDLESGAPLCPTP